MYIRYLYAVQLYLLNLELLYGCWVSDSSFRLIGAWFILVRWILFLPWWNSLEFLETTNLLPGKPHPSQRSQVASCLKSPFDVSNKQIQLNINVEPRPGVTIMWS